MTATTRLRVPDFETPAIPPGYELYTVDVREAGQRRGKQFADTETALMHVLLDVGWNRAVITLWLQRDDGEEGRMVYDCDADEWTTTLAEEE